MIFAEEGLDDRSSLDVESLEEQEFPNWLSKTTLLATGVVKCLSKGCQVFNMIT